jgi:hypothetical protein
MVCIDFMDNGLYRLHGQTLSRCTEVDFSPEANSVIQSGADVSTAALLHKHLDHFHHHSIKRMITHKGLPHFIISNAPYQACFQGKQSRASIPKLRTSESTQVLQLVHSDIVRPFQVKSLGGSSYFLTFIDDYSKKTWI